MPGPFDMSNPKQAKAIKLFLDNVDRFCTIEDEVEGCRHDLDALKGFLMKNPAHSWII